MSSTPLVSRRCKKHHETRVVPPLCKPAQRIILRTDSLPVMLFSSFMVSILQRSHLPPGSARRSLEAPLQQIGQNLARVEILFGNRSCGLAVKLVTVVNLFDACDRLLRGAEGNDAAC